MAEGLANRLPHNQSQDFSTTSSHNSSERSGSLSGWFHCCGWVRDGGVFISSSPGRQEISQTHVADRYELACPLGHWWKVSHWSLMRKIKAPRKTQSVFCKTYLELIGESFQPLCPALVSTIAKLALSRPFPDGTVFSVNMFPQWSSVYRQPPNELHEEINIFVELLTDSPLSWAVCKCCISIKKLRDNSRPPKMIKVSKNAPSLHTNRM